MQSSKTFMYDVMKHGYVYHDAPLLWFGDQSGCSAKQEMLAVDALGGEGRWEAGAGVKGVIFGTVAGP